MARRILAVALAFALASASFANAGAQSDGFLGVDDLPRRPSSARVVVFSLPDEYDACLPLQGACPQDSSSLLVVPAAGRRIVWQPEGAELPRVQLSSAPLPAVGVPPPDTTTARYLLPVVDGAGAGLVFTARGFVDGRFTMAADAPDAPEREPYVPVLAGPSLGGAAPSGVEPERLLAEPVVVDAGELATDPVPVLVVRRASPSRVAFGVHPDPSWRMSTNIVPLLGDRGVAGLVRHEGHVRLAVPAPDGVDLDAVRRGTPRNGDVTTGDDGGGSDGSGGATVALVLAAAVLAGGMTALVLRRRGRRTAR